MANYNLSEKSKSFEQAYSLKSSKASLYRLHMMLHLTDTALM